MSNSCESMNSSADIDVIWRIFDSGLRSFVLSKVPDRSTADDILQNTYLKIHENIGKLKNRNKLRSWIYQIARNSIINHFRDRSKADVFRLPEYNHRAEKNKFMEEAIADMIKMMDELPPEYCDALCLTELEGISQKDYAERSGLSYSGAKSRVQRARQMLRDKLLKCCHYHFDKYGTVINIQPGCCICCK